MVKGSRLAVVLPAFNEEEVIETTVEDALAKVPRLIEDVVIVVANDGSTDRTGPILDALVLRYGPRLIAVHAAENRGYGAALRAGFERAIEAGADLVFWMDSDGQFDPAELSSFLPLLDKHDAVLGYRAVRCDPWIRRVNAWGWRHLMRALFGIRVRDIDCAFKLVRTSFLRSILLRSTGAVISTEILARMQQAHLHVAEVPVHHYPRRSGSPTGARPAVILRAFTEAMRLRSQLSGIAVPVPVPGPDPVLASAADVSYEVPIS